MTNCSTHPSACCRSLRPASGEGGAAGGAAGCSGGRSVNPRGGYKCGGGNWQDSFLGFLGVSAASGKWQQGAGGRFQGWVQHKEGGLAGFFPWVSVTIRQMAAGLVGGRYRAPRPHNPKPCPPPSPPPLPKPCCRCAPEDLSKERGAVLEELRMGRDSQGRMMESHWKALMQGCK